MQFAIAIPVYKESPDAYEEISLRRLLYITEGKYPVYIVHPKSLDIKNYVHIYNSKIYDVQLNDTWFKSIYTYSQLCIRHFFYEIFNEYEYIYIYQLDSYLFRDELEEWCSKGYDYIGAPIFSKLSFWPELMKTKTPQVGNGGFSLRKVSTFLYITDPVGEFRISNHLTDRVLSEVIIEDTYFCDIVPNYYGYELKRPDWEDALKFSWDQTLDIASYYSDYAIPMGCHAWTKDISFWKDKICELEFI